MEEKKICGRYCSVPQCSNRPNGNRSFHSFPRKNAKLMDLWARALQIGKEVSPAMVVCGDHFKEEDFFHFTDASQRRRLKKTSVPSLQLPVRSHDKVLTENQVNVNNKRLDRAVQRGRKADTPMEISSRCSEDCSNGFGNLEEDSAEAFSAAEALLELQACSDGVSSAAEQLFKEVACQASQYVEPKTTLLHLIKSDSDLNAFTGIHSMQLLDKIVSAAQIIEPVTNMQLDTTERVVLTMVKIKLNISFRCIAILFGVSLSTCIRYFHSTLTLLSQVLSNAIVWLEKETVLTNMPLCFKNFQETRVVLDCTETPVEKPACLKCRLSTYSHYKGQNTLKFLIGVAPSGLITFISNAYGGRASDKAIFLQSELIEKLLPYRDAVMSDKGFLVEHELTLRGIKLIRPPFLGKSKQFSMADGTLTADIARARVHVERSIQRLKIFKILKGQLPWNLVACVDDIMTTAAGIVNLSKPILAMDKF